LDKRVVRHLLGFPLVRCLDPVSHLDCLVGCDEEVCCGFRVSDCSSSFLHSFVLLLLAIDDLESPEWLCIMKLCLQED
jgi:hypothetical protein